MNPAKQNRLYGELASWWHLMSDPAEYAEEADVYRALLEGACSPRTVLELGSGGGNNASHLKARFQLTLVDLAPGMLELSRGLNPDCEHLEGDMRDVRLGREFDAVFVHDAIDFMTTVEDLRAAIETAAVHCKRGGAVLLVPDNFRETFEPSTQTGGRDGDERSMRWLEWIHDPDPSDTLYTSDFAFLLQERGKPLRVEHDQQMGGLFARDLWLRLCRESGLEPQIRVGPYVEMILCRKGAS